MCKDFLCLSFISKSKSIDMECILIITILIEGGWVPRFTFYVCRVKFSTSHWNMNQVSHDSRQDKIGDSKLILCQTNVWSS